MSVGIMQPYFFPNLGHFSLIHATDQWIIFDKVQFIRHGWIERNRILKPVEGWQYISVPLVKHGRDTLIRDVLIRNDEDWKLKIIKQLEHYKKRAPYYADVMAFLEECFLFETESITLFNAHTLKCTCAYLGIPFNYQVFSEMDLEIEPVAGPGDWALNISKALGTDQYINPPGGRELFDKEKFTANGIRLNFLQAKPVTYAQRREQFEAGLSILDVMMFNPKERILEMLNEFELS